MAGIKSARMPMLQIFNTSKTVWSFHIFSNKSTQWIQICGPASKLRNPNSFDAKNQNVFGLFEERCGRPKIFFGRGHWCLPSSQKVSLQETRFELKKRCPLMYHQKMWKTSQLTLPLIWGVMHASSAMMRTSLQISCASIACRLAKPTKVFCWAPASVEVPHLVPSWYEYNKESTSENSEPDTRSSCCQSIGYSNWGRPIFVWVLQCFPSIQRWHWMHSKEGSTKWSSTCLSAPPHAQSPIPPLGCPHGSWWTEQEASKSALLLQAS